MLHLHGSAGLVAVCCLSLFQPGLLAAAPAAALLLPGEPLQRALQAAADAGLPNFTITPGEYNFSSQSLTLASAACMDIVAEGATVWFSPGGGVQLRDCTDVFIRGLTIDYTPTLAQGIVRSVDPTGSASEDGTASFTAEFDPTFLLPPCPAASSNACKVGFWASSAAHADDAAVDDDPFASMVMVRNTTAPAAVNIYTPRVEKVSGGAANTFRVFVRGDGAHGVGLAAAGQAVTVFHGSNPHSYTSLNCTRITLEGVSIYGGTGMGIVDGQGGGDSTYRGVTISRRPLQRGRELQLLPAPVPRLLATNEDGFHSNGNDIGPQIADSTIAFTGDDSGNICAVRLNSLPTALFHLNLICAQLTEHVPCCCCFDRQGMSVFLGQFSVDTPSDNSSATRSSRGVAAGAGQATFVDVQRNLLRARAGDVLSFYHLNTMVKQGSVTIAGTPTTSHNSEAIAKMR